MKAPAIAPARDPEDWHTADQLDELARVAANLADCLRRGTIGAARITAVHVSCIEYEIKPVPPVAAFLLQLPSP